MYNEGFDEVEHAYREGRIVEQRLTWGAVMFILFFGWLIGMVTAAWLHWPGMH